MIDNKCGGEAPRDVISPCFDSAPVSCRTSDRGDACPNAVCFCLGGCSGLGFCLGTVREIVSLPLLFSRAVIAQIRPNPPALEVAGRQSEHTGIWPLAHTSERQKKSFGRCCFVFFLFTHFFVRSFFVFGLCKPPSTHATMHTGREEKVIFWWGASRGGVKNVCVCRERKKNPHAAVSRSFF